MRDVARIRAEAGLPGLDELGHELRYVARWQAVVSLAVPWCCLGIYTLAALLGWWPVAVAGTVLLSFFTYGSVSHDLVHGNLGLSRRWNRRWLTAIEMLCLRSGTAYQAAHLHHHSRFPADDDLEGAAAGMPFHRAVAEGLLMQPRLWWWAWRRCKPLRTRLVVEAGGVVGIVTLSLAMLPYTLWPAAYCGLMIGGSWIIPVMTSFIPHDAHADRPLAQTRRFRGRLASLLAVEHLYHLEHHLYPQVPHHHWKVLARRLDPYLDRAGVEAIGGRAGRG